MTKKKQRKKLYMTFEDKYGNKFVVKRSNSFGKRLYNFYRGKRKTLPFYNNDLSTFFKKMKITLVTLSVERPPHKSFRDYLLSTALYTIIK